VAGPATVYPQISAIGAPIGDGAIAQRALFSNLYPPISKGDEVHIRLSFRPAPRPAFHSYTLPICIKIYTYMSHK